MSDSNHPTDPETAETVFQRVVRGFTPRTEKGLRNWVKAYTGVEIAQQRVCPEHQSPWKMFSEVTLRRPPLALVLGARGAGKSFLSALNTHLTSRWYPGHGTRILGGSQAQSLQIYEALVQLARDSRGLIGRDADAISRLTRHEANYANGSRVAILAASSTSVRGPHVPSLKLDEIDEIDTECREAAMGMCMSRGGIAASVIMTSTWHRLGGPMAQLMEQAASGSFPLYTFCTFEVLEPCPTERSGPALENCPACPIQRYCHDVSDGGPPRAKRSSGHYAIDALIQKLRATSLRTFEADYLCRGPRADGLWFPGFDIQRHVGENAEFDPALPVHLAIDSGVFTGAVWFQVVPCRGSGEAAATEEIHVFADYLSEALAAETNARAILEVSRQRCQGRFDRLTTDPAGGARNPVGPTVMAEYERVGLRPLGRWPIGAVSDGLSLVDSFVSPADGTPRLLIHPRCQDLIAAFRSYRRARRSGQWLDHPEDPQHPHEDLIDALRGGLRSCYPEGRTPARRHKRVPLRKVI